MTDSGNAVATNPVVPIRDSWPWRIVLVAMLTALADWLFFRQAIGVSLALFVLAIAAGVVLANRIDAQPPRSCDSTASSWSPRFCQALEDFNVMSALIAVLGIALFCARRDRGPQGRPERTESAPSAGSCSAGRSNWSRDLPLLHAMGEPARRSSRSDRRARLDRPARLRHGVRGAVRGGQSADRRLVRAMELWRRRSISSTCSD